MAIGTILIVAVSLLLLIFDARAATVPIDLVTTSASGLDPHISRAAARHLRFSAELPSFSMRRDELADFFFAQSAFTSDAPLVQRDTMRARHRDISWPDHRVSRRAPHECD